MRHSSFSLHSVAATAVFNASLAMRRYTYRGPWWQRSFSDGLLRGAPPLVTGESHFEHVASTNSRLQGGSTSRNGNYHADPNFADYGGYQPQLYSYSPRSPPPPPQPHYNPNQNQPRFDVNQRLRPPPPPQPSQPWAPRPKPLDYREWEYAKQRPPPGSAKLVVLSYNILADYLANDHRSKLYFHIPRRFLDWEWRKRSIIFELRLWSSDVMCFQEVDKFDDLDLALNPHGYVGIWKMRTGTPRDGCAIFWRASKLKLVHEECIEFNRLGLRDNVAQVCVLELLNQDGRGNHSNPSTSSSNPTRVVICNIHVLYNPKRGEIKLGQVRVLLDRAYAVSKNWSDAPVVICGDFNCVPQSPLYTFISQQKLDVSILDRDKVSGQASAAIQNGQREYDPQAGIQSSKDKGPASSVHENRNKEQSNSFSDLKSNNPEKNLEVAAPAAMDGTDWSPVLSCTRQPSDRTESADSALDGNSKNMHSAQTAASMASVDLVVNNAETIGFAEFNLTLTSTEEIRSVLVERDHGVKADIISDPEIRLCSTPSQSDIYPKRTNCNMPELPSKAYDSSSKYDASQGRSICVEEKLRGPSLDEMDGTSKADESFILDLHGSEASPGNEILQDLPPSMDSASIADNNHAYNPSLWTPMEIATATGNENCTFLNHSLKLQSTYAEVEDCFGTRDSNGEPIVTSYNRCFFGTVDYIWRSEGLHTVRVLAPIPVHAMKWTPGFPTRKWGSDHVALVAELAFTKHVSSEDS
ncbi:hypothetical protein Dimus_010315 [Dionaea muscipula]